MGPRGDKARTALAALAVLALLVLVVGCARIRSPEGGPADETDPFVAGSRPDSAAVSVGALDSLVLVFSEPMKRATVVESFRLTPPVDFRAINWEEDTLTFVLEAPLDSATTYVGLLGSQAADRRDRKLGHPWVWPFSTGDRVDPGRVGGQVVGGRIKAAGLWVYVWPWEAGPPDTTESYYPPDPIRLGQTNAEGAFVVDHLPVERPLRLCAFYDRDGDGSYQPLPDRWACLPDSVVLPDSLPSAEGIELFLAEREEPGVIAGVVVDSLCLRLDPRAALGTMRAERDSLLEWLSGEYEARQRGRGSLTPSDSVRIEREMAEFSAIEERSGADSLLCAADLRVELRSGPDSLVATAGGPEFRFTDVAPGIYRLSAFRDVDRNATPSPGEARGAFPFALEVLPLRTLDELVVPIEVPAGETLLRPVPAESDSSTGGADDGAPRVTGDHGASDDSIPARREDPDAGSSGGPRR